VADAAALEQKGVQVAVICTDAFTAPADAMACRHGFPGYRYATVPQPLSSLNADEVKQRAAEVLPEVLQLLGMVE
jgi:hypothetical protein